MRNLLRIIITYILIFLARRRLKFINPKIIGITGSVGKTTAKNAIHIILKSRYAVRQSFKSFNTEIGICLTILDEKESPFSSPKKWFKILCRAFKKPKEKYDILILEMGADKPGDLDKLLNIAKPDIGVITKIAPIHLENGQFKDLEDIFEEKKKLAENLKENGIAVLNIDDSFLKTFQPKAGPEKIKTEKITFGIAEKSDYQAKNIRNTLNGIEFEIMHKNHHYAFKIPVLGKYQVYNFLPAVAIGNIFGISISEAEKILEKDFKLPPGRMTLIAGINHSLILDSSYNASPVAVKEAISLLNDLEAKRKIAVIGTMNELGSYSEMAHLEIGKITASVADFIIFVGEAAETLKKGALEKEFPLEKIRIFSDSVKAGKWFRDYIYEGDLILVKGSQNKVRLENFIAEIMAEPENASDLLCRQEEEWERIG